MGISLDMHQLLMVQAAFDQIWPVYAWEFECSVAARAEAREVLIDGIINAAQRGLVSSRHLEAGGHRAMLRYRNRL